MGIRDQCTLGEHVTPDHLAGMCYRCLGCGMGSARLSENAGAGIEIIRQRIAVGSDPEVIG